MEHLLAICLITLAVVTAAPNQKSCKPGETWKEDCNTCHCAAGGIAACTRRLCPKPEDNTRVGCKEGDNWSEDCNMCTCQGGAPVCTLKYCLGEQTSGNTGQSSGGRTRRVRGLLNCTEGETWKEKCNSCFCSGGHAACTRKFCFEELSR